MQDHVARHHIHALTHNLTLLSLILARLEIVVRLLAKTDLEPSHERAERANALLDSALARLKGNAVLEENVVRELRHEVETYLSPNVDTRLTGLLVDLKGDPRVGMLRASQDL